MINSMALRDTFNKHLTQYGKVVKIEDIPLQAFFKEHNEGKNSHDHKYIFTNTGEVKQGNIIITLGKRWIAISQPININNAYEKSLIREIKFGFKWNEKVIPCIMDSIASTVETSNTINVPYTSMNIMIQETEENKTIAINDNLFVANKKYRVEGIDNSKRGLIALFCTSQGFATGETPIWNALVDVPTDTVDPPEEPIDPPIIDPTIRFNTNTSDANIILKFINGEEEVVIDYDPTGRPIYGTQSTYAELTLTTDISGYAEILYSDIQTLENEEFINTEYNYKITKSGYRDTEGVILKSDIDEDTGIEINVNLVDIPSLLFTIASEGTPMENTTITMKVETSLGIFAESIYNTDSNGFVEVPVENLEVLETEYTIIEYSYRISKDGFKTQNGIIPKVDIIDTDINIPIELEEIVVSNKSLNFTLIGNTSGTVLSNTDIILKVETEEGVYSTITITTDLSGVASIPVTDLELLENQLYPVDKYEYEIIKGGFMNYNGYVFKTNIDEINGADIQVGVLEENNSIRYRIVDSVTDIGIPNAIITFHEDSTPPYQTKIEFVGDENGYIQAMTNEIDAIVPNYDTRYRYDVDKEGYTSKTGLSISKSLLSSTGYQFNKITLTPLEG